jgi:aspartyl-tRNA(Asn)/glutamyl-tRNA(Gln) amidotransferase subunit A
LAPSKDVTAAWQWSAAELAAAFRDGRTTPAIHLKAVHGRISALNPQLNAIIALASDIELQVEESESRIKRGRARSALEGIPVLVKDNILAKGMPCVWGSRVFRDYVPAEDELPVARLRAAGAIVLGKTNVPELTFEGITWNPVFGATRNPYDLGLTPGGSSGGSVAAVAAGLVPLALGTDGGGSIRRPASHTGLVGLKPSIGAVPRVNSLPLMLLDLEVIGPIARTVEDTRLLFDAIAGPDPRDRRSLFPPFENNKSLLKILYVPRFGEAPLDPEIAQSVDTAARALESMGCQVETGQLPLDLSDLNEFWPRFGAAGVAYVMAMHPGKENLLGPRFRAMLDTGRTVSAAEYLAGFELFERLRRESERLFERWDIVMTPSAAALPWPAEQPYPEMIDGKKVGPRGHAVYTGWVNACGIPAISLPCAPSRRGMPIGFQLAARFGADRLLLDISEKFEAVRAWRDRWPEIAFKA